MKINAQNVTHNPLESIENTKTDSADKPAAAKQIPLALDIIKSASVNKVESPPVLKESKTLKSIATHITWDQFTLTDRAMGKIEKRMESISKVLGEEKIEEKTLDLSNLEPTTLSNGETLHPLETAALRFYSADGFRLMNGIFNFETSVNEFIDRRGLDQKGKEEIKQAGLLLSMAATSALNKLPPATEHELYRGSAIQEDQLHKYAEGSIIPCKRFSSYSSEEEIASEFARTTAINDPAGKKIPALYILSNPTNAKDISAISTLSNESERLYTPDTAFRITRVEKDDSPIRVELNDEDEINAAREKGTLKSEVNAKGKTKYYTEEPDEDVILKIYIEEVK